ncbi:MAG: response regulator [Phormidesmis sp.]
MVPYKYSSSRPSKLLVVDDLPDNLFLMEAVLGDEDGYQVEYVDSGKAALESIEESVPDLILLDIMMPEMTGYEVTRRIRQDQTLPHIPIILVTAHDELGAAESLQAGADGFIHKPFDIEEMLATIESTLQHCCVSCC